MVVNLELGKVSTERINELQKLCSKRYKELVSDSLFSGKDLEYTFILQELCKFANSPEEVALISATAGKFLLK